MRPRKAVEKAIRMKLDFTFDPPLRDQLLARAMHQQEQSQDTEPALPRPVIRRMIMRSPIVRLAIAAAVVAAVLIGATLFRTSGSGVVWAEVARKVQASRDVIFRTVRHDTPDPYDSGVDFSIDHYSSTQSRVDMYKGGEINRTIYGDCNTKTVILVDHYHKSYVKMTLEQMMPDRLRMDPNSMVQRFLSCEHRELGPKTIDGVLCKGIETTDPAFYGGGNPPETPMARLWVSVETGYPAQFEGERVYDDQRHTFVQDQFQWDVELDENIFEPNIPDGYIDISP